MPDPTPPPASIGIEEQIAWCGPMLSFYEGKTYVTSGTVEGEDNEGARLGRAVTKSDAMTLAAILSTLRRVPALERVAEAARELLALDGVLPIDFTELKAALAATKEP